MPKGARGDLYAEMKPLDPMDPKERQYAAFLHSIREQDGSLPHVIGTDLVQRLLISLQQIEKEATMYRLTQVMAGYGYKLDAEESEEGLPVFSLLK